MAQRCAGVQPQPGERAALLGLGVSNRSLASYLARRHVRILAYDQKSLAEMRENWDEISPPVEYGCLGDGYLQRFGEDIVEPGFDWVFVTPGMRKDIPQLHRAREMGCRVSSELALFMNLCPARMIGVTGSSGKTTTASLVADMLQQDHKTVHLGGNIGRPLTDRLPEIAPDDLVVLEISSFQLELADSVPQLGVILNITPDHLDVHGSMEAYVQAKSRMIMRQAPGDFALLNADCALTRELGERAPAEVGYFSASGETNVADLYTPLLGEYRDESLWLRERGFHLICRRSDLPLRGMHNVGNVLAASVLARRAGVSLEAVRRGCLAFAPVPHRLEEVDEIAGVLFVNDSIATSPERARAALRSYRRPMIVLMGGYDKGLDFAAIGQDVSAALQDGRIRSVVLMGDTADAIEAALRRCASAEGEQRLDVVRAGDLDGAFALARERARPGDVVIMSPACASFDAFANYRDRGTHFRHLVEEVRVSER